MTPRLVIVTWNDANGTATKVYEDKDHAPVVISTVGWLLKKDDAGISIACERYQDDEKMAYRGHTFIPAGMVLTMKAAR